MIPIKVREALGLRSGDLIVIDVVGKVRRIEAIEQGNGEAVALF